jgi:hypothetical protein
MLAPAVLDVCPLTTRTKSLYVFGTDEKVTDDTVEERVVVAKAI